MGFTFGGLSGSQFSGVTSSAPVASTPAPITFNVAGSPVASGFGRIDSPGARTMHLGGADASYDSYGKRGTPIHTMGSGVVSNVVAKGGGRQGNFVDVDYGGGVQVRYYHMDSTAARVGQKVGEKDVLGTMGASGYSPSGSHASYKFMKDGKVVPGNVAFPTANFPTSAWGKQGGGSWSGAVSFDPKTQTFTDVKGNVVSGGAGGGSSPSNARATVGQPTSIRGSY